MYKHGVMRRDNMDTIDKTIYKSLCNDPDYDLVSFCKGSIPTPGSECRTKRGIDPDLPGHSSANN